MTDRPSNNNSDQMRACLTDNSGNAVDQTSSGGIKKQQQLLIDLSDEGATSQTRGTRETKTPTSPNAINKMGGTQEKMPPSGQNAENRGTNPTHEDHEDPKEARKPSQFSASGESRASYQPSQSTPMDTSDASSSEPRPKPGSTYPIQNLKTMQDFTKELNQPLFRNDHTILINLIELQRRGKIVPYPGAHVWDSQHVKLPHLYPPPPSHHKYNAPPSRWDNTCRALQNLTTGNNTLGNVKTAILSYNSTNKDKWTFDALYYYGQHLHEVDNNLHSLIPKMASLALELPNLIQRPIPLLRQQQNQAITMSQRQISSLLANAFFCTFPHRNDTKPGSEYANYPTINFSSLFANEKDRERLAQKAQKLRSIFHYFNTVTNDQASKPDGLVTFERISIPNAQLPDWNKQKTTLKNLHISSEGSIEEEGAGMLQVDFASKYIGGGVLKSGLVQEEILFLMSPELIVARLFTEKLADNECLKITGPQMYSLSTGYSRSFSWDGPYNDRTQSDMWRRRYRQIVAIDALEFKNPKEQYTKENITRELNKAFVGFNGHPKTAIATGNWGCGAFKGDPKLKALIQLMAAAVAGRDMAYFTFGNKNLAHEVQEMHKILTVQKVTVDKMYKLLKDFCEHYTRKHHSSSDLYEFISDRIAKMTSLL